MLQVEHGGQQLTSERRVHPLRTDASSGVGNSSAQTVDAHVPREWEEPASEALREGWSEAEVCAEEVAAPRKPLRGRFSAEAPPASSRSNCQQGRRTAHREAATARDGARLHREAASQRKARRHRDAQPAEPAPSGSNSTAQSKAPSGEHPAAKQHRESAPQRKAQHHREEQPAEPAASGRALFVK